jgi:hypothetical protein
MGERTDFLAFYEQLGLRPDCSADELRVAYRRRVAELHPDRRGGATPRDAAQLQELTATYAAASLFLRRHGRLPGAAHARLQELPRPAPGRASCPDDPAPRSGTLRPIALTLIALGTAVWLLWANSAPRPVPVAAVPLPALAPTATEAGPAASPATPGLRVELGMDADTVRVIEGRPLLGSAEHWDYGPSWIEFRDGRVSDWYSSPLHPLQVATRRPPPAD